MEQTLHEVLVRALKKLEYSSFQKFIERLSVLEVRKEYTEIPKKELIGKDPEQVAGLIEKYYKYAYGAEVTLSVLEDIDESMVQEELQDDLSEVDTPGHGLGTAMFTDMVTFTKRHISELVDRIKNVDPVVDDLRNQNLLTLYKYYEMRSMSKCTKLKEVLCAVLDWEDIQKYKAYRTFRKYNEKTILYLEMKDRIRSMDHSQSFRDRINFIKDHQSDLIEKIQDVDPVLHDLLDQELLTEEQYNNVMEKMTSQEKMRQLCDIIRQWEHTGRYMAYTTLIKYNEEIIKALKIEERQKHQTVLKEVSQETEDSPKNRVKMSEDNISCKLCGKDQDQEQELAEVASTMDGMYRLELKSPGLYRCQKTGIKFLVKEPVTIEYKFDSWSDHLTDIPDTYETLGPLFNIRTSGDPSAVSAVHLPHYLCLKSFREDTALIKCAHFKDGNLTLIKPMRIDPFYIILENPTFSCLGPLLSFKKKKILIHGMVLMYFTILCRGDPLEAYNIHLYVLPYIKNAVEILDEKNRNDGYQRINKPEQTIDPVCKNIKYRVTGRPGLSVRPLMVKFQSEPYHKTEIQFKEKDVDVFLSVSEEKTEDSVWDTQLTQSDIKNIAQLLQQLTIHRGGSREHFVDQHRKNLIDNISSVAEVLDDLKQHKLLTNESYDNVLSKCTSHDQMREIYRYVESWDDDDKDIFYQALERHNPSTMKKLSRK